MAWIARCFCRAVAWPLKAVAMLLLFMAYFVSTDDPDETLDSWMRREL